MRVVIIGPGRIGCGYLAPLFASSGWEIVLAARNPAVAMRIEQAGGFVARTTGGLSNNGRDAGGLDFEMVGVGAVAVGTEDFVDAVAGADLICTSVGVSNVQGLARPLASALAARGARRPVDVWVVENADCASGLGQEVAVTAKAQEIVLPPVGFAGAVAGPAVAHGSWRENEEPVFIGDATRHMFVDSRSLLSEMPSLPGVELTAEYEARLKEKLCVFNSGHAICAYLGWLRGHTTISQAVGDPFLRPMIAGCLLESRKAVLAVYPMLGSDVQGPVADALERFGDAELADPVTRVAREPIRKISAGDRLIGTVDLIRRATGKVPVYFSLGLAGALLYRGDGDKQGEKLQQELAGQGVLAVLEERCALNPVDPFAQAVAYYYRNFVLTEAGMLFPPVYGPRQSEIPRPQRITARRSPQRVCVLVEAGSDPGRNPLLKPLAERIRAEGIGLISWDPTDIFEVPPVVPDADLYLLKGDDPAVLTAGACLADLGAPCLNSYEATAAAADKARTLARLGAAGLPVPITHVAGNRLALRKLLCSGPRFVKPARGAHGNGAAVLFPGEERKAQTEGPWLVQEVVKGDGHDFKVYGVGNSLAVRRTRFVPGRVDGLREPVADPDPGLLEMARSAAEIAGLVCYGVDFLMTAEGPILVDLNYFPGYRGVDEASGWLTGAILSQLAETR